MAINDLTNPPFSIIINDATPPQPIQRFSNPQNTYQRKPQPIPSASDDQALDGTISEIVSTSSHIFHQTLATTCIPATFKEAPDFTQDGWL